MNNKEASSAPAVSEIPAVPPGTTLTTLDNGLVIIVREDHSAPVVSVQAWSMAGSIHEGRWLGAGLSHVLEHMLFKGTTTRPGSRIDQEVQEAGGYMNAYTSFDRTVYHIDVPSSGAATAIDILCDIMQNATLPSEELEKEKQVIVREMDMNVDDPQRRASRRLFETAYTRSPYRYTVIGYRDIFDTLTPEDIVGYYKANYAPNNIFFVVAGDISSGTVVEQIRKAFSSAKSKALPPFMLPAEPVQTGPREVIEEAPIELGYSYFVWHTPDLRHPDAPVLDVLAIVLGNGRSSRLYREVREKGLVHSIGAWTYSPAGQGLFAVSATLDGEKLENARKAIYKELERVRTERISAGELSKAVKQFVASTLAARKTMQGQAQDLGGSWLSTNDLNFSERFLDAVKRVTPEDLQRVANTYLASSKRTVYCLLPAGTVPKQEGLSTSTEDLAIRKVELSNGLRLLVKEDHHLPFVELRATFGGGVLAESEANSGITQLMGKLLLKGTKRRSAEEISQAIEEIGGSIESYGGNNSFGVHTEVLSGDFALALDVFADVVLNPAFPVAALEREREAQLAGIRAQNDHLLQTAIKKMRRTLFGPQAYGLDPLGTEESVTGLSAGEIAALHRTYAVPENCVITVFGDLQANEMIQAVERAFGSWNKGASKPQLRTGAEPIRSVQRAIEPRDKKQAVVVLGFPGLKLTDPDRYALELLQEACSDLGSRLFLRIREELSLAYYVGAQNFPGVGPGYFAFYAGTLPDKAAVVEEELKKEALLLRSEGLTEPELNRSKAKVLGQRKIARQELGQLAMTAALDELHGLGYDWSEKEDARYEAVTLEDIRSVAGKYLNLDAHVVSLAGQIE